MIVRSKRPARYTIIDNRIIEDAALDWRDLGLLVYLLSKPDDWQIMPQQLCNARETGKHAIYETLKRLRAAGYASHKKQSDGTSVWTIYDTPNPENQDEANPNPENPDMENPNQEKPNQENQTLLNTEYKPTTEKEQNTESARSAKKQRPLPDDFTLSDRVRDWANRKGYKNLDAHFEYFCNKAAAKGYKYIDWDRALMNAIADDWAGLNKSSYNNRDNLLAGAK